MSTRDSDTRGKRVSEESTGMGESMNEAEALVMAIAEVWGGTGQALLDIEPDLIDALRDLEAALEDGTADTGEAQRRVVSVLNRAPEIAENVAEERLILQLGTERGSGGALSLPVRLNIVPVVYATNRAAEGREFGADRGTSVSYGIARVAVKDDARTRTFDVKRYFKMIFGRDAKPTLSIDPSDDIRKPIELLAGQSSKSDVLVFVHGYRVAFEEALIRAAKLVGGYQFQGTVVAYSWPSAGNLGDYAADNQSVLASEPHFLQFLTELGAALPVDAQVHIVAHSMGNQLVTTALRGNLPINLGHLIFAAPDVDSDIFAHSAYGFPKEAERYTLYASSNDRALKVSNRAWSAPRAGNAGADLRVFDGVDTIDASEVDTDFMGHSYALDERTVTADVFYLLTRNLEPGHRYGLNAAFDSSGKPYWVMRA